ncbi:hypothetical protein AB0F91_39615 [Amycolatopsis sp. NPDC023774]|uniref:hypothetical protein n=1 Tax=Amycolatopsis sp. NPDC023774 TaxID=3155015 RepID=UPI0033FD005E
MADSIRLIEGRLLPAGADVERIVRSGDERELFAVRETYRHRRRWQQMADQAVDEDDRRLWEPVLAATAEVTPLQELAAAHRLARILTSSRWYVMRDAREAGASWPEIGVALEMSKQAAQEWYQRKIADQE